MKNPVKKIAAINDLSGVGRSSLTAMIPVISYMGIQVCPVPTSVLSTQTSGYENYSFVDLTDTMKSFLDHWIESGLVFDCIFSGFLGSEKQADIILDFVKNPVNHHSLVIVDPVMGDNGQLYDTVNGHITEKMKKLVSCADIILPNQFEALYLLEMEQREILTENQANKMMKQLSAMGPEQVVITGARIEHLENRICTLCYDSVSGRSWKVESEHLPVYYPGTGDAFASVFTGSLLSGKSLPESVAAASEFVLRGIRESCKYDYPAREGILIEKILGTLKTPEGLLYPKEI